MNYRGTLRAAAQAAILTLLVAASFSTSGQQRIAVISRCGGVDSVTIPTITDHDHDGMDDNLELLLLNRFMPTVIQFDDEGCPGPAIDGSGDSNIVVARIFSLPQQYTSSNSPDSVKIKPVVIVPAQGLTVGLNWYNTLIKVNAALLYGKDCGALGHTADVEGFNYSIKYTGTNPAGWMYDTVMANWAGGTIQTVSHAGTLCEHNEVRPYKSTLAINMFDTLYASPDKHGNYLTTAKCGSSFICNPDCKGIKSRKTVKVVNIGEPDYALVTDLGTYYAGYAGEDPWGTTKFLQSQGGSAGTIRDKMLLEPSADFLVGEKLTSQSQICGLYSQCYGPPVYSFSTYTCHSEPYDFNGRLLTMAGTYHDTVSTQYGCDSTITLNLAVTAKDTATQTAAICQGYTYPFNGHVLTAAGTYTDTLTNALGCDSIRTLVLQVNEADLIPRYASFCMGNTYQFNGRVLTSPGQYSDTLTNANGCDSIVILTLVSDSLPVVTWNQPVDSVDIGGYPVILIGANPAGGVFSGPGVSGNLFYPNVAGLGQHTLTYTFTDGNGCSAQSTMALAVLDNATAIDEADADKAVSIYPNPADGRLTIAYPAGNSPKAITLINAEGEEVQRIGGAVNSLDISGLGKGVYLLRFDFGGTEVTRRLAIR